MVLCVSLSPLHLHLCELTCLLGVSAQCLDSASSVRSLFCPPLPASPEGDRKPSCLKSTPRSSPPVCLPHVPPTWPLSCPQSLPSPTFTGHDSGVLLGPQEGSPVGKSPRASLSPGNACLSRCSARGPSCWGSLMPLLPATREAQGDGSWVLVLAHPLRGRLRCVPSGVASAQPGPAHPLLLGLWHWQVLHRPLWPQLTGSPPRDTPTARVQRRWLGVGPTEPGPGHSIFPRPSLRVWTLLAPPRPRSQPWLDPVSLPPWQSDWVVPVT